MSSKSTLNKKVDPRRKGKQQESENAKFRKKESSLNPTFDFKDHEAFTTFKFKGDDAEGSDDTDSIFIFPRNWPEWSDAEINLEGWKTEDTAYAQFDNYHDPEGILLPHSLIGILDSWKRPHEAFNNQLIILYDDTVDAIDIISNNKHLLNSRCMRWIISSIATVQVIADESAFPHEGVHSQFTPTGGIPWRPWHHIYSLCKAGKVPHKPLLNPAGKYVIRLYYLGCWRKFVVDDKLPFDSKGRMLLPASSNKGELWPMLLTKGLLKIALHTWNKKEDLHGFQPISCLTGWICEEISNIEFDDLNLWKLIKKLTEVKQETIEETPEIEIKTDKKPKKENKSSHHIAKKKTSSQQIKETKPTEIVGILRFWNEKYNSNEVVHQIFPSNEEKLPSPRGISSFEPIRRLNFPVLFQQYKEKEITRSRIKKETNEYFGKELSKKFECEKQDVPECFIKAYSHIFDLKEEPPKGLIDENKEEPILEVKKSAKEAKRLMSNSSKLLKPSQSSVAKSVKGKSSTLLRKPPNTQKIMTDTGKWLTFSSLKSLLDGIVLLHKPSMFNTNIQKPDFNRLFLQKVPSKTVESMDDIDDESELDSELDCEEELFIFLDSPDDIELVLSMNVLPTPTKLDNNYGTLFDLMINACEGRDEEYLNYKSPNQIHENINSVLIDETLTNKKTNDDMALSKDWKEFYDEYEYELMDVNGEYVLKECVFDEKDAEVMEVCEDDASNEEGEEWEVDDYIVEMYNLGDFVKKNCEERVHISMPEDGGDNNASVMDGLTLQNNSYSNKEEEESQKDKDGLEKYLLTRTLTSISLKNFSTTGEIEAFTGDFLFGQWPYSKRSAAQLELEAFKWDESNVGHPSLQFSVTDTKVVHFELPPGRSILRVTIRSVSFYALHLLSNVGVVVSSKEDLYPEMMKDCARLTHYENKIRQNIENLVIKLAEQDYQKTIRDFNNCYLPDNYHVLPRDTKELLHEAFQGCIYKILTENSNSSQLEDVVKALGVVFLNPSFGKNNSEQGKISDEVRSISIQQNKAKLNLPYVKSSRHQEAALKIQSFFKRILCRNILRNLQKNRSLLSTRLSILHNLLRDKSDISIIRTMLNETPILKMVYDLKQDLENEINMYEWAGLTMDIEKQSWIPLVRYIFKCDSKEPIKSSIQLTCPLTTYITSIIDNDTGKQLPRINNSCSSHFYKENRKGYTFFAYGVNENQSWSFVPWKINHIVRKGSPFMEILINGQPSETGKPPKLRCDTLNGYYLPNKQKIICSFLMELTELSHISLCFSTSNKSAVFKLELINSNIGLITAEEAEGMLVIPSMFLKGPDKEKGEFQAVYNGKVTLLNDWPLSDYQTKFTDTQWIKDTALFKVDYHVAVREHPKFSLPGSPMDFKAKQEENLMEDDQSIDNKPAKWSLHILLDSPNGVMLKEIKQKGDEIKNMKREWEKTEPSILQKNAELYKTYKENDFKNCFGYSKKEPTRFKNKLPLMKEFQEHDDEDKSHENSKQSDSKLKTDSKKYVKSNKKLSKILDNSSDKSNESLLESESICDITPQNELQYKSGAAYDDHWVDHSCGIDCEDINIFNEMSNGNGVNTKLDDSRNNFRFQKKNEHSNNEPNIFERRSSSEKTNESIFSKTSKSIACKELYTTQNSDLVFNSEDQDKFIEPTGKYLEENAIYTDDRIKSVDFENKVHGHIEKEDEKCCIDHYKNYYESQSDNASSSSHDEVNEHMTPKLMTVEDWVKIQTKMVKNRERFKKRLIKVFTEVESLVRAPFKDHFTKWNLYLVQTLKNTEDPFHQIEKLRNAYRRAKKKQNILRKQKIKLEIKRIKELKASMSKKGKKGKNKKDEKTKPKKEKTKAK